MYAPLLSELLMLFVRSSDLQGLMHMENYWVLKVNSYFKNITKQFFFFISKTYLRATPFSRHLQSSYHLGDNMYVFGGMFALPSL